MNSATLIGILHELGRRLSANQDGFGQLEFSHRNRRGRTIVGEPDLGFVLANLLWEKGVKFGLEQPTAKQYRYKERARADRGNIDVTLDPSGPGAVDIELKAKTHAARGEFHHFAQDLMKLLGEPVSGAAMVHLSEKGKTERVFKGYAQAFLEARALMTGTVDVEPKWFLFFLIDRRTPECVWRTWDDVRLMESIDFTGGPFRRSGLREAETPGGRRNP